MNIENSTTIAAAKPIAVTAGRPAMSETGDGDDDGHAGEQHGLTGGGVGDTGGVLDRHPLVEVLTVAGDDEQCVVDADAEADHRRDHRRDHGRVDEVGHDADAAESDAQPEQGGHDRDRHRDQRTERDEQHDHRDGETDVLAAVDLDVDQGAGELGLDAAFAGDARLLRRRASACSLSIGSTE